MTTTHRPAPGPARDYRFPRFHRFSLTNGLRVIVAPVAKLPIVTILAVVDAGAAADPAREEGVELLAGNGLHGEAEHVRSQVGILVELAGCGEQAVLMLALDSQPEPWDKTGAETQAAD